MPDYRRWFIPGGTYFFTLVTYRRRQFLTDEIPRRCLREAIAEVRKKMPFEVVGIVLLPDHLHMVVSLPTGERHYSTRLRRIKESFTESFLASGGTELPVSESRRKRGERGIWQRRFWEHTVRDEDDLQRCVDYVHWNPRKHGLVDRVRDWPYSTFHRFVAAGEYDIDWGGSNPFPTDDETVWGE